MTCNVSKMDRLIRIIGGAAVLSLVFIGPKTPWGYVGLVPLLTGIAGFCPAYLLIGKKSC